MDTKDMLALAATLAPDRTLTEYDVMQLRDAVVFRLLVELMPQTIERYSPPLLMSTYGGGLAVRPRQGDNGLSAMLHELVHSAAYQPQPLHLMDATRWVENFLGELAGAPGFYRSWPPLRDLLCWAVSLELARPEQRDRLELLRARYLNAASALPLY